MIIKRNYIAGEWLDGSSHGENLNPSDTRDVIGLFARASQAQANAPTAGVDPHVPFGGRKGSSHGSREQGRYAAEFFTTVKTVYVRP